MSTVTEWLQAHPEAAPLVSLVRDTAPLDEAVKWGRPNFTVDNDWHHWVCAVSASRTSGVNLVFHNGKSLPDPEGVLTGDFTSIRKLAGPQALASPDVAAKLIREAIARQHDL